MKISVLSYNIRNCRGINNRVSLDAVASTIAGTRADIIGLQEVDYCNPRSAFAHQAARLSNMLGMYYVYGPNVTWGCIARFGNAVLSRYPILCWHNYPLPSYGEQRGLLRVEIKLAGQSTVFFTTHLGLNHQERMQQVEKIMQIVHGVSSPLLLTGDFNAKPYSEEIKRIQNLLQAGDLTGAGLTFPSDYPKYKIDYIFHSHHWTLTETKVYSSLASDHLPLLAKVELARAE
ncbi:endonuclease/exonuclease/phosphatase family protein [Desulfoscipio gibsoniae]|uniref:Metal-dependent hydrolase n=1 Tax=Desulfoscipio gibsoniae DSM 7213 TaxID=767817 RepID=R4KPK6_9FIRM|nr:endonuclease/exonuclease/phosphatase family protein [Desulfoscipio gibsoniae]AGL01576.1 metal-dependent hydrolase [Desulfoscipio gibsoniae DSM 7213]